jgi:DNA gyrase/topoisomerase IV subunit A
MNLKTKIKGHIAQIIIEEVELKNSSIYQLIMSVNAKENIKAEIERLEKDIDLAVALGNMNANLSDIFQILRSSKLPEDAKKEITERFNLKPEHVQEFLELELSEVSGVKFNLIAEVLSKEKALYQGILNDHFDNK